MTELPKGWVTAPLKELGKWQGGGTPSKARPEFWGGTIPWVSPKDMKTATITKTIDGITPEAIAGSAANLIAPGSILLVTRSGILAHSLPAAVNAVEVAVNQDLKAVTPLPGLSSEYIRLALKGFERAILNACVKDGTTVHSVELLALMGFEIPLPPLPEQRRIVAKIEALFSELDAGQNSLTRAQAQLKLYRQSLLKAAFQGSLTADWRAVNPDSLEAPETLLSRICTERDSRYKQALADWQQALATWRAGGEVGRKPSKPSRPEWPQEIHFGDLMPLPEGWAYLAFEGIAYTIRNGISQKPDEAGTLKIFRISAVRPMLFDLSDFRYLKANDEFEDFRLRPGDLVFTRYNGSRAYVGVAAAYRGDGSHVYPDKLIRCDVASDLLDPGYLEKAVNCGEPRAFIEKRIRTTAGQAGISGADLKAMPVPVCAPEEQRELNRILDEKLSQVDAMETEITTALAKITALRQSILKQAFSGRLVSQDPSDEPASALLARLRETALPARARRKKTA